MIALQLTQLERISQSLKEDSAFKLFHWLWIQPTSVTHCYDRTISHPLSSRHLISWRSAFPWISGAEYRRFVSWHATSCLVPCSPCWR